jgi:hypothetical protein
VADVGRRFLTMRFGAAEVGMSNRWRGHEKASKLETAQDRKSRLYTRYPHKDFLHNDPSRFREGLFQELQQFVGIGFKRDNKENSVHLFDWENGEGKELEKLKARDDERVRVGPKTSTSTGAVDFTKLSTCTGAKIEQ